jgi:hypothetical protein
MHNRSCDETRRSFLKRSAYAAPTLLALGTLAGTQKAQAGFGNPPSDIGGTSTQQAPSTGKTDTKTSATNQNDSLVLDNV